jgi:hypothetical protein
MVIPWFCNQGHRMNHQTCVTYCCTIWLYDCMTYYLLYIHIRPAHICTGITMYKYLHNPSHISVDISFLLYFFLGLQHTAAIEALLVHIKDLLVTATLRSTWLDTAVTGFEEEVSLSWEVCRWNSWRWPLVPKKWDLDPSNTCRKHQLGDVGPIGTYIYICQYINIYIICSTCMCVI